MASARFDFLMHPLKLQIYVASGVDKKTARKMLRRASAGRRALVRENPRAFILYVAREVIRNRDAKQYAVIDDTCGPAELVFQIYASPRGPKLAVIEHGKKRYDGFFYRYIGSEVRVKEVRGTGHKYNRVARLKRFREDYKKEHGYYPDETPPASKLVLGKKIYSAKLQKLRNQQESYKKQFANITMAHRRRKERRKKLKQLGVSPPKKFDIKEHYSPVPDKVKTPE